MKAAAAVSFSLLISTFGGAAAATTGSSAFDPPVAKVCDKSSAPASDVLFLDRKKLLDQLSESSKGDMIVLVNFLNRHRRPVDPAKGGIDTTALAISGERPEESLRPQSVIAFLNGPVLSKATCYNAPKTETTSAPSPASPFVSIRQTVDDLKYAETDMGFKGAKAANIAASNDRIANKYSVAVDVAVGYVLPRYSFDERGNLIGQLIPFVSYDQQFVQATPKTSSYAENLAGGATGDLLVWERHDFSFTPKYVESLRNHSELFSGTFGYTPMWGIPGIDNVIYLVPETLSLLMTPQLKYVARDVTDVGTGGTLLKQGSVSWFGGRGSLSIFGEGRLDGFVYNVAYEQYYVDSGVVKNVSNFLTSINYSFGADKLASIQLQYQRGRNLDTLESINMVTLGLGLKL